MKIVKSIGRARGEKHIRIKRAPAIRLGIRGRLSVSIKYKELFEENEWCSIDVFDDEVVLTPTSDSNEFKTYKGKTNLILTCSELGKYLPLKVALDNELIDGQIHIKIPKE